MNINVFKSSVQRQLLEYVNLKFMMVQTSILAEQILRKMLNLSLAM